MQAHVAFRPTSRVAAQPIPYSLDAEGSVAPPAFEDVPYQFAGGEAADCSCDPQSASTANADQPLLSRLFRSSADSPPWVGRFEPLAGTSWLNRPYSVGGFVGVLDGDQLIADRVDQGSSLFGGVRWGWDFDYYWGIEGRLGWSSPDVRNEVNPSVERVNGIFLFDAAFLYYPFGDTYFRPYLLAGAGVARNDFTDEFGMRLDIYAFGVPLGAGVKYMLHPNFVLRAEFLDNIAFATSGLDTQHDLSFTLGLEVRYGGQRPSYYPWQPGRYIW